ncbi:hypothetical protein ACWEQ5_12895 [Streptomyces griseoincarnatus]
MAAPSATRAPELTAEKRKFLERKMSPEALAETEKAMSRNSGFAFPIATAAIGAAAWCATGARAGIPTSVLSDIAAGKASSEKTYVRNAVIDCCAAREFGHDVVRADRTGPRFAP